MPPVHAVGGDNKKTGRGLLNVSACSYVHCQADWQCVDKIGKVLYQQYHNVRVHQQMASQQKKANITLPTSSVHCIRNWC